MYQICQTNFPFPKVYWAPLVLDSSSSLKPREPDIFLEMENLFGISDIYNRSLTGNQIEIVLSIFF